MNPSRANIVKLLLFYLKIIMSEAGNASIAHPLQTPRRKQSFGTLDALKLIIPTNIVLLLSAILYYIYHKDLGIKPPTFESPHDRVLYALKLQFFPAATLILAWHWVWLYRVHYPILRNPLSGYESLLETPTRVLQNTVEQTILFTLNTLVFAILAEEAHMVMLPFAVFCFTIGRVAFAVGYSVHPIYRIPGFIFTFVPSMTIFWYNGWKMFF